METRIFKIKDLEIKVLIDTANDGHTNCGTFILLNKRYFIGNKKFGDLDNELQTGIVAHEQGHVYLDNNPRDRPNLLTFPLVFFDISDPDIEIKADAIAFSLGYGPGLLSALKFMLKERNGLDVHLAKRIVILQIMLAAT